MAEDETRSEEQVPDSPEGEAEIVTPEHAEYDALVKGWLSDHWKDADCPVCGENQWTVGFPVRLHTEPEISLGYQPGVYTLVLVTCGNCGLTRMFMANALGLLPGRIRVQPLVTEDKEEEAEE